MNQGINRGWDFIWIDWRVISNPLQNRNTWGTAIINSLKIYLRTKDKQSGSDRKADNKEIKLQFNEEGPEKDKFTLKVLEIDQKFMENKYSNFHRSKDITFLHFPIFSLFNNRNIFLIFLIVSSIFNF